MRRAVVLALLILAGACRRAESIPPEPPPTQTEIWTAIQAQSQRYQLEPGFIYALVAGESNFDPRARNGNARGLLQLTPTAWGMVSDLPYRPNVWMWRQNLETGIDYVAHLRSLLMQKQASVSYPLLLASYLYGPEYVEQHRFQLRRMPTPDNEIYRALWNGNPTPIPPPVEEETSTAN